ncbi:PST-A protein [Plasmodium vivax]|uniref:PST-A protein n=2 Tax=Plasmodium vivax TaxID=5855 RepID=A5KCM2_PLAVS|nr:PST-A protein [Plasmodium vivax]EDL42894.1 PST-A protein [Plasmodium vivax]KNA02128.1 PST-A protein [Plasmodium vivax North Korean]|eukprot:XP_001612668.1 PST-A protein [Plasmodium vivax Sal-1]
MTKTQENSEALRTNTLNLDGNPKIGTFFNKDGLSLRTYEWGVENPRGIIILIHGIKSHVRLSFLKPNVEIVSNDKAILIDGENYYLYKGSWVEEFNRNGYSVHGMDLQGHGLSEGWENLKAHIKEFDDYVYDVVQHIAIILKHFNSKGKERGTLPNKEHSPNGKNLPIYFIGYSLGGNVALRILQMMEDSKDEIVRSINLKGCILLAPVILYKELAKPDSFAFKFVCLPVSKMLCKIIPRFQLKSEPAYQSFPFVIDIGKYDALRYKGGITIQFGYEILRSMHILRSGVNRISKEVPLLFIHSRRDSICYYDYVLSFFERLEVRNKEMYTLEHMDHALTKEPGNEEILQKIVDWIGALPVG